MTNNHERTAFIADGNALADRAFVLAQGFRSGNPGSVFDKQFRAHQALGLAIREAVARFEAATL